MCLIPSQAEVGSSGLPLRDVIIWVGEMYTQETEK